MTLTVNGQPAEPGCYVDGRWGQYGPDHFADQLEGFGIVIDRNDDPRRFRRIADWLDNRRYVTDEGPLLNVHLTTYEARHECADDLIDRANDVTEGGYWEWYDGEVFLRSYICPECHWDARWPMEEPTDPEFNGPIGVSYKVPRPECDYCCDADDPGCFA